MEIDDLKSQLERLLDTMTNSSSLRRRMKVEYNLSDEEMQVFPRAFKLAAMEIIKTIDLFLETKKNEKVQD